MTVLELLDRLTAVEDKGIQVEVICNSCQREDLVVEATEEVTPTDGGAKVFCIEV